MLFSEPSRFCELLLFFADRAHHIETVIVPALSKGVTVISDRFFDATFAYQIYGREIDKRIVFGIDKLLPKVLPDITFLLDIDPRLSLIRVEGRGKKDRFEKLDMSFHKRVREGYLELSKIYHERFFVIDASLPKEEIHEIIKDEVRKRFNIFF